MKKLTIIGASGHGKVVADIAKLNGYDEIVFLDDNETIKTCGKYPVVGCSSEVVLHDNDVFVAIGNAGIRKKIMEQFSEKTIPVLIHPNAVIADDVKIGKGTVIMAGVVINAETVIGEGCIINTSSSVDHDCRVGDYVHVAVGSHLCGTVAVGNESWVGAGATVSNNISICASCIIGAGSVIVKDITERGTYMGVPARLNTNTHSKQGVLHTLANLHIIANTKTATFPNINGCTEYSQHNRHLVLSFPSKSTDN